VSGQQFDEIIILKVFYSHDDFDVDDITDDDDIIDDDDEDEGEDEDRGVGSKVFRRKRLSSVWLQLQVPLLLLLIIASLLLWGLIR